MKIKIKCPSIIKGEIEISGSKNACLPIIAASLLSKEEITLYNVPLITDVISMIRILDDLGVSVNYNYVESKLVIRANRIKKDLDSCFVSKLRASYYLISPLIHRKNNFATLYPGGCNFGKRPIDFHLKLYKQMGLDITEKEKIYFKKRKLRPINYTFSTVTVGGTINAILSTVLIKGKTTLSNIAIEPEVIDVIHFLQSMGAKIQFIDKRSIVIEGVKELHKTTYSIMPDRIEAGSYMFLAMAKPNSQIKINKVNVSHLENVIEVINKLGGEITIINDSMEIKSPENIKNINISTGPYPYFPTDLQPILSTVLLNGNDTSKINETIYPSRNSHIKELSKMKASIEMNQGLITINPSPLISGMVQANDLRCGFAMIVAGVISGKQIIINQAEYIFRGYDDIMGKLCKIGIKCKKE